MSTELFRNEQNLQLYYALGELKEEYREALYLVYFENMSYRDAVIVMRKNKTQVAELVHYGKQNLRTFLEQEDFRYADV